MGGSDNGGDSRHLVKLPFFVAHGSYGFLVFETGADKENEKTSTIMNRYNLHHYIK